MDVDMRTRLAAALWDIFEDGVSFGRVAPFDLREDAYQELTDDSKLAWLEEADRILALLQEEQ